MAILVALGIGVLNVLVGLSQTFRIESKNEFFYLHYSGKAILVVILNIVSFSFVTYTV